MLNLHGMLSAPEERKLIMSNDEQHEMLCDILAKLVDVLDVDELSLLAHCCGVRIEDFYVASIEESDLFNEQLKEAA